MGMACEHRYGQLAISMHACMADRGQSRCHEIITGMREMSESKKLHLGPNS